MQFKNIILLLASALFIFACSSTKPPVVEDTASVRMDMMHKGFLLSLPEGEGWKVVKKSNYKVLLSKRGPRGRSGYTIQVLVVSLPAFETDDEFLAFIEKRMDKSLENSDVIEKHASLYAAGNKMCVQYNSKENRTAKSGTDLTLETVSITCHHPDNPDAGVYMALSKSYVPDSSDEDMTAKAIEIFNNLYFTEL